jgi:pilus assembly protein CpaD
MNRIAFALLPLLLAGCVPQWDMQGNDPKDFYVKNPIQNKVETKHISYEAKFEPGEEALSAYAKKQLRTKLSGISPYAVDTISVQLPPSKMRNAARKTYLTRLLRGMGFSTDTIIIEPSDALKRDEVSFSVTYAAVVSPRCPDWRTSPVTTYSNTQQGGFGCANTTNLGLMVADPRDLLKGSGDVRPDTNRNNAVIEQYRTGEGSGSDASSSGGSAGGDASGAASSSGSP